MSACLPDTDTRRGAWATCPRCGSVLYPNLARWTPDGWACASRARCARLADSAVLGDEIAWLRSFGWRPEQIARRLGVTTSCVEKRLAKQREAA